MLLINSPWTLEPVNIEAPRKIGLNCEKVNKIVLWNLHSWKYAPHSHSNVNSDQNCVTIQIFLDVTVWNIVHVSTCCVINGFYSHVAWANINFFGGEGGWCCLFTQSTLIIASNKGRTKLPHTVCAPATHTHVCLRENMLLSTPGRR